MTLLSRRAAVLLPLATAGCGFIDRLTDEESGKKLPGKREEVIVTQRGLVVDSVETIDLPPPVRNDAWPQFGGNPAHEGGNLLAGLGHRWTASFGAEAGYRAKLLDQPVIADGRVFTMDTDGSVDAFDLARGTRLWRTGTKPKHNRTTNVGGGIGWAGGKLYATTGRGETLALDPGNGRILWRTDLSSPARSAPTIADGAVFTVTIDDRLLAVSADDGRPLWHYEATDLPTAVLGQGAPAFSDGLVVAGFGSGDIACLRADSGSVVWSDNLGAVQGQAALADFGSIRASPAIAGGLVYAISLGGLMAALDLRTGRRVWQRDVAGYSMPWVAGNTVFVVSQDQKLAAMSAADGGVMWITQLPHFRQPNRSKGFIDWVGPVLAGGKLILLSDQGHMAVVDPTDGTVIEAKTELSDKASVSPVVAGGNLFITTNDAILSAFG